jgi:hypothetical protein
MLNKLKDNTRDNSKFLKEPLITSKEELVKYLQNNLDITINLDLDLKLGTHNISRLNFKQNKRHNDNTNSDKTRAVTTIQRGIRGMLARKIKPKKFGRFTVRPLVKTVKITAKGKQHKKAKKQKSKKAKKQKSKKAKKQKSKKAKKQKSKKANTKKN